MSLEGIDTGQKNHFFLGGGLFFQNFECEVEEFRRNAQYSRGQALQKGSGCSQNIEKTVDTGLEAQRRMMVNGNLVHVSDVLKSELPATGDELTRAKLVVWRTEARFQWGEKGCEDRKYQVQSVWQFP